MTERIAVALESAPKKAFASALEWPGWSRSGKTDELAVESLIAYAPRYAPIASLAGFELPVFSEVELVDRQAGGSGTTFGVPSHIHEADRRPVDAVEADRLASIVDAAWTISDHVAAGAPAELRKGPRGGGRDRDRMVAHVIEADWYYAREVGLKLRQPDPADRTAILAIREQVLDVLCQPSDGSPIAGRKWTARYAARRIAWHALDHGWEMQDRSTPA